MKSINNYITEKLKITTDTKILKGYDGKLNNLESFGHKYNCKVVKDTSSKKYEFNTLTITNNKIKEKIQSFFKLDHSKWLDLYFTVREYVEKINNLDKKHYTSIKRDLDKGIIEIECKNLTKDIKYGHIKLYEKDNIISQVIDAYDDYKEKIDNILVHILDYIINENN